MSPLLEEIIVKIPFLVLNDKKIVIFCAIMGQIQVIWLAGGNNEIRGRINGRKVVYCEPFEHLKILMSCQNLLI